MTMTKEEFSKAMFACAALFPSFALTEQVLAGWFFNFRSHDAATFLRALRAACNEPGRVFFPSGGEVQKHLFAELPRSLQLSAAEALDLRDADNALIRDAREFADRATPDISRAQFDSPEELERANRMNAAIWAREFRGRFERQQQRIVQRVVSGVAPTAAIAEVVRLPGAQSDARVAALAQGVAAALPEVSR